MRSVHQTLWAGTTAAPASSTSLSIMLGLPTHYLHTAFACSCGLPAAAAAAAGHKCSTTTALHCMACVQLMRMHSYAQMWLR
jgi:hypothetical protein